ncbi:MAG: Gfo/Idh/MocA family oxidoreductase [Bryobacteraceae bacterium]|jgi:predicted dehydrogenase
MLADLDYQAPRPVRTDFAIGVVGAGFILREVQLKAYRNAGFNTVAMASRTPEIAREVAELYGIPKVYDTVGELLRDPQVEIVDVAVPPDQQLAVIREIARHAHSMALVEVCYASVERHQPVSPREIEAGAAAGGR